MKYRPEFDPETVGANLRRLRKANKLTVEEVRQYLMLGSVQAVYKCERGESYPQADTMFALMCLYGASLGGIIGGSVIPVRQEEEGCEPSSYFDRLAA